MPRYLLLGRLRDELQLAALLTLLIPTNNVANGLLALKANANAKAPRAALALDNGHTHNGMTAGFVSSGVSGTGWSSKGKAWYEKGNFGEPWFDMWESRLRHVDLKFWDRHTFSTAAWRRRRRMSLGRRRVVRRKAKRTGRRRGG